MHNRPSVLVFDVNETLIDIVALEPHFERMFGDRQVLREWFGQLVMYSMAVTLSGNYIDFFALGQAVLRMTADVHRVPITDDDVRALGTGMATMPAHPDVADGLRALSDQGYRLVTLTNSPPSPNGPTPLEHAGLAGHFERQFSVDPSRVYKPSVQLYDRCSSRIGGSAVGVHDGRRPRVGSHRCAGRRVQRRAHHPPRQRATARTRLAATDGGRR